MEKEIAVPRHILKATHDTLKWAMVFCRNYALSPDVNSEVIYDLMDAIHPIPEILDRWDFKIHNIDELRLYFGCFNFKKWQDSDSENLKMAPDLVTFFNNKLNEYEE